MTDIASVSPPSPQYPELQNIPLILPNVNLTCDQNVTSVILESKGKPPVYIDKNNLSMTSSRSRRSRVINRSRVRSHSCSNIFEIDGEEKGKNTCCLPKFYFTSILLLFH